MESIVPAAAANLVRAAEQSDGEERAVLLLKRVLDAEQETIAALLPPAQGLLDIEA